MKENTCCEKCLYENGNCANSACRGCHQPATEESECECPCHQGKTGRQKKGQKLCNSCQAPKDSLKWEDEFERYYAWVIGVHEGPIRIKAIKDFVKEQITKAKEEERARIRGVIGSNIRKERPYSEIDLGGNGVNINYPIWTQYNAALTDILKEIGE